MAIDKEKFTDSLLAIAEKKKQIREIAQARRTAEQALYVEYEIMECNQRRAQIQSDSDAQISVLQAEINALETSLGQ